MVSPIREGVSDGTVGYLEKVVDNTWLMIYIYIYIYIILLTSLIYKLEGLHSW